MKYPKQLKMCDMSILRNTKIFIAVVFFVMTECNGLAIERNDLVQSRNGSAKQNLPTSNVQVHFNETSANNTEYITTITFDIDFVQNTTQTTIVNHRPVGDLPHCGCYCGIPVRKNRIVGGNETKVNQYPWIAAMYRKGKFYCSGALISRRHMLTAAHCVYGFNPQDLRLVFGEHDRTTTNESETVERKVKMAKPHPRFDLFSFNNDIAVVELDKPMPLGNHIRTACLPDNVTYNYTGVMGIIAGWGRVEETKPTSSVLRQVTVPIMSTESCRKLGYMGNRITDNMLCAGFEKGEKDACQGDSGGPMVIETTKGNLEIAGIVSWGRGCARPNYPGVYTKVVNYLSWIEQILGDQCLCQKP